MSDSLVTIKSFESYIEANLAKQILEDEGITAFISGENAANIYSGAGIALAHIQVLQSRAEQAKQILEQEE